MDDPEKIKSIAGITSVWVEEASELTQDDFMQLNLRLRDRVKTYHQIILTFNPISAEHWLKKYFFDADRQDTYILKTTYKDNRFLTKQYVEQLEKLKDIDENYYNIYCLGEWGLLKGQIYTNWEVKNLKGLKFDNYCYGLDFGFSNDPTAFIKIAIKENTKEIFILKEFFEKGITNDVIAEKIKPFLENKRDVVFCDSAEPKSIKELQINGINAKPTVKGKDSIVYGIQFIKQYKLIVDSTCINVIKELQLYKWQETKDGEVINKPIDAYCHGLDGLRYALTNEMKYKKNNIKILPSLY